MAGYKTINDAWGLSTNTKGDSGEELCAFFNLEDLNDDDEVGKWLNSKIDAYQSKAKDFTRKSIENLMFIKGLMLDPTREYSGFGDLNRYYTQSGVSFNIAYEFVELWVNRMGNFKAEISVVPSTNGTKARDNAEAKELAVKDFFFKNKVDQLLNSFDRHTFSLGEGYIHAYWDQDRGPLHPEFKSIEKKYKALKRVSTESGTDVNINRLPRIGDVALRLVPAINVYFDEKPWDELDHIILEIPTNVDELRSDHPHVDISGSGEISCFWFYHLPTKYLPKGRFVKLASEKVLHNGDYIHSKPIFPVIRCTNIDMVGAYRGRSFIENIKSPQILINETISEVWDNLRRTSKGKWLTPAKSVNLRHLDDRSPAVEYYGSTKPEFITYQSLKGEAIQFIELMRDYAEKQARIQGITQGAPPPNVRSGLQFAQLEEMEKRSVEITVAKKYAAIEQLGEVVSMIMGENYKEEDGRHVTIYGKDKEYLTKALNVGAVQEDHPVRVKTEDSLPTGKASQMSFFSELRGQFGPNVVPDELMIDMLDSGRFNQYTEFGGATVETTLAQISQILDGETPVAPAEYEDLVLKWKILVGTMRKRSYLSYEEEVKKKFEDMVYAIEDMLINKPQKTAILEQTLQSLPSFPIYYRPETISFEEDMPPMPQEPQPAPQPEADAIPSDIPPELLQEIGGGIPQ